MPVFGVGLPVQSHNPWPKCRTNPRWGKEPLGCLWVWWATQGPQTHIHVAQSDLPILPPPPRRVAEHNQEVQQLCEALEQQIQEERQRMEQEVGEPSTPPLPPPRHPAPQTQPGADVPIATTEHSPEPPALRGAAASVGCQRQGGAALGCSTGGGELTPNADPKCWWCSSLRCVPGFGLVLYT